MSAVRPTQRFAVAPLNDRFRESQFGRRTARICANLPGHGAASARTRGPGWRRWEKSVAGFDRFGWPTLDHYGRLGWSIVTGWIARHTQFSVRTHLCGPRLPGCGRPKALSASVRAKDLSVVGRGPGSALFPGAGDTVGPSLGFFASIAIVCAGRLAPSHTDGARKASNVPAPGPSSSGVSAAR